MIKLKSKDYDLKALFQYDLLRDILLSLAEYQNDIHLEILALKNYYKTHDKRISKLEEKNDIKFDPSEFNLNVTNFELSPIIERIEENQKNGNEDNKKEEKSEKEGNEKNEDDKKKEDKKEKDDKNIFSD
jgi:hypothetical protein